MTNYTTEEAVRALLNEGNGVTEIAKQLGLSRTTVYRYKDKIQFSDDVDLVTATGDEFKTFMSQLAPIVCKPDPVVATTGISAKEFAVVIGDTHFGAQCERTLNVFYQTIELLRPENIILNGDTVDLLAVSRYPKDVRYEVSLLEERVAYHKFLRTIRDILGDRVKIIETNANHSGNGVEGRWWRFLSERLGPLGSLPDVINALSYGNVFIPEWANVDLVESVELCNGALNVMHGDVVRKQGGQSVLGMMDKWHTSILMNHTHRMGMTAKRIPGIGRRSDSVIYGYENGCACELKPSYATAANWQNGFAILKLEEDSYGIEQVSVGKNTVVNTLDTVFKS